MALYLNKQTGDSFTADEFNQIIAAINGKQETETAIKVQLLANEAAYNEITTKDQNTIYAW